MWSKPSSSARTATSTVAATVPIALLMGIYMTQIRPGRVLEATILGLGLVVLAVFVIVYVALRFVNLSRTGRAWRSLREDPLAAGEVTVGEAT